MWFFYVVLWFAGLWSKSNFLIYLLPSMLGWAFPAPDCLPFNNNHVRPSRGKLKGVFLTFKGESWRRS